MIGVRAQGGLGNQLFQFAFAYAYGKKNRVPFFMHSLDSLRYFKLYETFTIKNSMYAAGYITRNLFRKSTVPFSLATLKKPFRFLLNRAVSKNVYRWENTLDNANYLLSKTEDNILYDGFFQSEEYFVQYKEELKALFEIRKKYQRVFLQEKKMYFEKKCIAIHLRRRDYVEYGGEELGGYDMRLPVNFYKKCLSLVKDADRYNVIFVSDDIAFAKKEFGERANYFYESNDEITDFQLLLHADVVIIANSTFSWWAAWLNNKAGKTVYAPEYFLGFKVKKLYPAGIRVRDWNWIDIN